MNSRILVAVFLVTLFSCAKEPEPTSPFVGEWHLQRITYSGFPEQLQDKNRTDSDTARIGTDTLRFLPDSTFTHTYRLHVYVTFKSLGITQATEAGTWTYNPAKSKYLICTAVGPAYYKTLSLTVGAENELSLTLVDSYGELDKYLSPTYRSPIFFETLYFRRKE